MGAKDPFCTDRVLIVAAHPDDEVIGGGGQLARLRERLEILEVTDGSPDGNPDYAWTRRQELDRARALAGIPMHRCHRLGYRDQDSSFHLAELARRLAEFRPDIVLTHPYEGGHPDHDSCAFAVAQAFGETCPIYEFTSYHAGPLGIVTGKFLGDSAGEVRFELTDEQKRSKQRMFECFTSQRHVLADFRIDQESFRPAPQYDFTQPPHPGQLHYEQFNWGVTGHRWRELAAQAVQFSGIRYP